MVKNSKVNCPYSCKGKMRYTRLIYHLAKGCPNMDKLAFEICDYNWVHRVPRGTLEEHYQTCDSRPVISGKWREEDFQSNWNSVPWNSALYEPSYPPYFFPDY